MRRGHFLWESSSLLLIYVQETSFWTFAFCLMPSSVLSLFRASAGENSLADRNKEMLILLILAGLFTPNKSMTKLSLWQASECFTFLMYFNSYIFQFNTHISSDSLSSHWPLLPHNCCCWWHWSTFPLAYDWLFGVCTLERLTLPDELHMWFDADYTGIKTIGAYRSFVS